MEIDGIFWLKAITVLLVLDMLICKWVSKRRGPVASCLCIAVLYLPFVTRKSEASQKKATALTHLGNLLETCWNPVGTIGKSKAIRNLDHSQNMNNGHQWTTMDNILLQEGYCGIVATAGFGAKGFEFQMHGTQSDFAKTEITSAFGACCNILGNMLQVAPRLM